MRIIALLVIISTNILNAQNVITPWWGSIFAEGNFTPGEWDQAPRVDVQTASGNTCQVAVAVDSWGVFFGFMGHLESDFVFPEVLLDTEHDRSAVWNADDQWFHVSATGCHHAGAYGVYDDCSPLPEDWSGHPNFSPGAPSTDSVEIAIPWWYLGIEPMAGDTIGLGLVLTNTASSWNLWPAGASRQDPSTWGHLVFPVATAMRENDLDALVQLWPNPTVEPAFLAWKGDDPADVRLIDALGQLVWSQSVKGNTQIALPFTDLPSGPYTVSISANGARIHRALIKL